MTTIPAIANWEHQTASVFIYPHCTFSDGCKPLGEDLLFSLYLRTREEGLLPWVFPGMDMDLATYAKFMADVPLIVGFTKDPDGQPDRVAGYGWLWGVEGQRPVQKAMMGFCMFRESWGTPIPLDLGRLTLEWWFEKLEVAVLFGMTRKRNSPAVRFAMQLGFTKIADVPNFFIFDGQFADGTLVTLTKEQFKRNMFKR